MTLVRALTDLDDLNGIGDLDFTSPPKEGEVIHLSLKSGDERYRVVQVEHRFSDSVSPPLPVVLVEPMP